MGKQLDAVMQHVDQIEASGTIHPDHLGLGTHVFKAYQDLSSDERWNLLREMVEEGRMLDLQAIDIPRENPTIKTQIFDYVVGVLLQQWRQQRDITQVEQLHKEHEPCG